MLSAGLRQRNTVTEQRMASLTTMRIGGVVQLVRLEDITDIRELREADGRMLGKGANIVCSDNPHSVPVIQFGESFSQLRVSGNTVHAGAAVDLAKLMKLCLSEGLAGPEGLAGVPASVGGALYMNAGTGTCCMYDWVSRVQVLLPDATEPCWINRSEISATYRSNGLPIGTIFCACEMDLQRQDAEPLRQTARALKQAKAATQPLALRSAGCMFKNPQPQCPAGKLIDELGLKGERRGSAEISPIHGNFIVNHDNATAKDVYSLVRIMRQRAWAEREIVLQLEVETWDAPDDLFLHPKDLT